MAFRTQSAAAGSGHSCSWGLGAVPGLVRGKHGPAPGVAAAQGGSGPCAGSERSECVLPQPRPVSRGTAIPVAGKQRKSS